MEGLPLKGIHQDVRVISNHVFKKGNRAERASEMAQRVKVLAARLGDLSSIHGGRREIDSQLAVLCLLQVYHISSDQSINQSMWKKYKALPVPAVSRKPRGHQQEARMQIASEPALQSCPQVLSTAGHHAGVLYTVARGLTEASVRKPRDCNQPKSPAQAASQGLHSWMLGTATQDG